MKVEKRGQRSEGESRNGCETVIEYEETKQTLIDDSMCSIPFFIFFNNITAVFVKIRINILKYSFLIYCCGF